ncbi:histidine kinase [Kocuria sp.]|uniref:sensor histidine kinase n=1 Tax=Kocuria sp. TaxID=1871328 RepID=UPI0028991807|nr:histidine kinase [Kocuria sp.]
MAADGQPSPHRLRRPQVVPAALTAVLAAAGVLLLPVLAAASNDPGSGFPPVGSAPWWVVLTVVLAQAVALLWTRNKPVTAAIVVTALPAALVLLAPGPLFTLTALATAVAAYYVATAVPNRQIIGALAAPVLLVAGLQFANEMLMADLTAAVAAGAALLQAVLVIGAPVLIGLLVAARREAQEARLAESAALQRERDVLVQADISRERTAMSRELHDIAAHHMSGIALLAGAVERQIDNDPSAAKRSVAQIRAQSRTVLDDLRRLVGLLREEAEAGRTVATLPAVQEFVEAQRDAGAGVELVIHTAGAGRPLDTGIGPLAQVVVFRMVQESLANIAEHAPGARSTVTLDDRADELTVVVANGRPPVADPGTGGGFGLLGMRERAEMIDADLAYGPTADGGWQTRLTVPRDPRAAGPTEYGARRERSAKETA